MQDVFFFGSVEGRLLSRQAEAESSDVGFFALPGVLVDRGPNW